MKVGETDANFVTSAFAVPMIFLFIHPLGWIILVSYHKAFWWILPGVWSVAFLLSYLHDQKTSRERAQWHKSNYRPRPPPDPRSLDEQFPGWKKKANKIASKIDGDARDRKYEALWKKEVARFVMLDQLHPDPWRWHDTHETEYTLGCDGLGEEQFEDPDYQQWKKERRNRCNK